MRLINIIRLKLFGRINFKIIMVVLIKYNYQGHVHAPKTKELLSHFFYYFKKFNN
jgi:hypothetical protein